MNYLLYSINSNDYKNLENILKKCNLKIKKSFTQKFCEKALCIVKKKIQIPFFI